MLDAAEKAMISTKPPMLIIEIDTVETYEIPYGDFSIK